MHDHGPSHSMAGLNTLRSHHEWELQSRKALDMSLGTNTRKGHLLRERIRLLDVNLELEAQKPRPVGPVDNLGVDTSLDLTFTDITEPEKKMLMSLDESEDDIHASDAAGHSMSPFGRWDAELRIPSSGYLSDDNSHPLYHDTSGGGQPMQSQTAWVPHKSLFLSPVRIMTNSVINSVPGRRLYGLVKPLLMRTCDLKQASVKDKVPRLWKDKQSQWRNEKTQGLSYHSASLTRIGRCIHSVKYPTAKNYKSPYKERQDTSRIVLAHAYRKRHESDAGNVNTPSRSEINRTGDLSSSCGVIHMSGMDCHRSVYSVQEDMLARTSIREKMSTTWAAVSSLAFDCDPKSIVGHQSQCAICSSAVLEAVQSQGLTMFDLSPVGSFGARLRPKHYQRTCSMAPIVEFESILFREAKSDCLEYWIRYACLYMVKCQDVRLPDERHVCWKKRRQKDERECWVEKVRGAVNKKGKGRA